MTLRELSRHSVTINEHGLFIDGEQLSADQLEVLAPMLGFDTWGRCQQYWLRFQRLPFQGWIVFWKDFE